MNKALAKLSVTAFNPKCATFSFRASYRFVGGVFTWYFLNSAPVLICFWCTLIAGNRGRNKKGRAFRLCPSIQKRLLLREPSPDCGKPDKAGAEKQEGAGKGNRSRGKINLGNRVKRGIQSLVVDV